MMTETNKLRTPYYVIDEKKLRENGEILRAVSEKSGAKILLAQKCFSIYPLYPILSEYLDGTEASGLFEAKLGAEKMPLCRGKKGECHVFSAAFKADEFSEVVRYADHIVFNSINQLRTFGKAAVDSGCSVGLRINPLCSTQKGHEIYDPCAAGSRLGVTRQVLDEYGGDEMELLEGLHFHTLCEQNSDALEETYNAVCQQFNDILPRMKWLNFGGGHHITRPDYDIGRLCNCIRHAADHYGVQVYLEPGEAVALNAGELITTVLDVQPPVGDEYPCAIVDTSAACHMPDVLEMPYRPPLEGAGEPGEKDYTYRIGSQTCLAGDVIGDFSFSYELSPGMQLKFGDMAIYTMVKNNTFNGMPLPDIVLRRCQGELELIRRFSYEDFISRLG